MTELILLVGKGKTEIVNALKMKNSLWEKGITITSMALKGNCNEVPPEILENLIRLKIVGSLN